MIKLRKSYLWLFFLVQQIAFSQQGKSISKVSFQGLGKTQESYVERFVSAKVGQKFDTLIIKKDLQELRNLQLFYEVNAITLDTLGGVELTYEVKEVITQLPIVGLGWTNTVFWSELGGMDLNTLGRGIQSMFKYRFYQRNSFLFFIRNPHYKSSRWGYELQLNRLATVEPLYFSNSTQFYDYDNNSVGFGFLYWLFKKDVLSLYTQYIYEDYRRKSGSTIGVIEGPEKHQTNKVLIKLSNQSNYVNYIGIRLSGMYNFLSLESIQSKVVYERFVKLSNEFKYFKLLGSKGNVAVRLRMGISSNNDTPFASFVADNYVNIRGIGDRAVRGTAEMATNVEYRQLLITKKALRFSVIGFVDSGTWRAPGAGLSTLTKKENISVYSGVGGRLHFHKFYNAILRADYSFDTKDFKNNGLIVGVGQYF